VFHLFFIRLEKNGSCLLPLTATKC